MALELRLHGAHRNRTQARLGRDVRIERRLSTPVLCQSKNLQVDVLTTVSNWAALESHHALDTLLSSIFPLDLMVRALPGWPGPRQGFGSRTPTGCTRKLRQLLRSCSLDTNEGCGHPLRQSVSLCGSVHRMSIRRQWSGSRALFNSRIPKGRRGSTLAYFVGVGNKTTGTGMISTHIHSDKTRTPYFIDAPRGRGVLGMTNEAQDRRRQRENDKYPNEEPTHLCPFLCAIRAGCKKKRIVNAGWTGGILRQKLRPGLVSSARRPITCARFRSRPQAPTASECKCPGMLKDLRKSSLNPWGREYSAPRSLKKSPENMFTFFFKLAAAAKAAAKKFNKVVTRGSTQAAFATPTQVSVAPSGALTTYREVYHTHSDDVDPLPPYVEAAHDDVNDYTETPAYESFRTSQRENQYHQDGEETSDRLARIVPTKRMYTSSPESTRIHISIDRPATTLCTKLCRLSPTRRRATLPSSDQSPSTPSTPYCDLTESATLTFPSFHSFSACTQHLPASPPWFMRNRPTSTRFRLKTDSHPGVDTNAPHPCSARGARRGVWRLLPSCGVQVASGVGALLVAQTDTQLTRTSSVRTAATLPRPRIIARARATSAEAWGCTEGAHPLSPSLPRPAAHPAVDADVSPVPPLPLDDLHWTRRRTAPVAQPEAQVARPRAHRRRTPRADLAPLARLPAPADLDWTRSQTRSSRCATRRADLAADLSTHARTQVPRAHRCRARARARGDDDLCTTCGGVRNPCARWTPSALSTSAGARSEGAQRAPSGHSAGTQRALSGHPAGTQRAPGGHSAGASGRSA
ncbi:hypothetical protein DFH06DRAFT_1138380 [Mycena polygramma]|nr:hypothetical protein DFH06DRAFT_1138380 [Mycena polygramma]